MPPRARYLIVDGHSVIFAWSELRKLHARRSSLAREALIKQLRDYQDWTGVRVVVVFDGKGRNIEAISGPAEVQVFYSRTGQTADAIIERLASKYAKRFDLIVATSDSMDQALEEAGIDRKEVYVTNAVKHFKWEPRGKRRIHQKPNSREIAACRPWLEAELRLVKPKLLVCLGATAAQTVFGPSFRVTRERGKVLSSKLAPRVLATVHPSSLLRQPDEESRQREYERFVVDLRAARRAASKK